MRARYKIVAASEHALLGAYMRSLRLSRGVSQREVSEGLGLPQSFISKVERGERQLQVVEFVLMCRWLKLDAAETLGQFLSELPGLSTLGKPIRVKRANSSPPQ